MVLTVYGIETHTLMWQVLHTLQLQQYLPFTVLKLVEIVLIHLVRCCVATVPTVYGIETCTLNQ